MAPCITTWQGHGNVGARSVFESVQSGKMGLGPGSFEPFKDMLRLT